MFFRKRLGKKAYEAQKLRSSDIDLTSCNLNGWQRKLIQLCSEDSDILSRHIELTSRYPTALKKELINNLQLVYALLSGELDDQYPELALSENDKADIISKLMDGVVNCTAGFHDRVNGILLDYLQPKTIPGILTMYRRDIVDRVARQTTSEVHAHNQIFSIANRLGYGIPPINDKDIYGGQVQRDKIIYKLIQTFTERYHPFAMLLAVKNTLSTALSYTGPRTGYQLVESRSKPDDNDIAPGTLYFYQESGSFYCAVNDDGVKRIPITEQDLGDSAAAIGKLSKNKLPLKTQHKDLIFEITGYPPVKYYKPAEYNPGLALLQTLLNTEQDYSEYLMKDVLISMQK